MLRISGYLGVLFAILLIAPSFGQEEARKNISILYTGDTHGHLNSFYYESDKPVGGIAKRAIYFQEKRRHKSMTWLTLDAGDALSGTALSDVFQGFLDIQAMNKLKYDAMVLGVHEFDYGVEVLRQRISEAEFPVLSANLVDSTTGQPFTAPYAILERDGVKIAIMGLTTGELANRVAPENFSGLTINDPVQTARLLVPQLASQADVIIALTHMGISEDIRLASQVSDIDVIVGGMSHSLLQLPLRVGTTLIVHDSVYGKSVGLLKTTFSRNSPDAGYDRVYHSNIIEPMAGKWVENSNYQEWLESFREHQTTRMMTYIGRAGIGMSNKRAQSSETELGNYVCDTLARMTGAEIAILPAHMFKGDLPQGDITLSDLFTVIPYDHYAVVLSISGGELQEILNDAAGQIGTPGFPQVSGVSFGIFNNSAFEIMVNGAPLDPFGNYTLVTSDFLAAASLGYANLGTIKDVSYTGRLIRDLIRENLEDGQIAASALERRIEFLAQEPTAVIPTQQPPAAVEETTPDSGSEIASTPPAGAADSRPDRDDGLDRTGTPLDQPGGNTDVLIEDEEIADAGSDATDASQPSGSAPEVPPYVPPAAEPLAIQQETIVENGIEYVFTMLPEPDEGFLLRLNLKNVSSQPLTLAYSTSERFDFEIYNGTDLVWRHNNNWFFAQGSKANTLSPGESRAFEGTWDGKDLTASDLRGQTLRFEAVHTLQTSPVRVAFTALVPAT